MIGIGRLIDSHLSILEGNKYPSTTQCGGERSGRMFVHTISVTRFAKMSPLWAKF